MLLNKGKEISVFRHAQLECITISKNGTRKIPLKDFICESKECKQTKRATEKNQYFMSRVLISNYK